MIDINKKYRTRQGWEVELFTDKASGEFPIVGQMLHPDCGWTLIKWNLSGAWATDQEEHPNDLIEVKEKIKITGIMGIWRDVEGRIHFSQGKDGGMISLGKSRVLIAAVDISKYNIEVEEGEGIDG